MRVYHRGDGVSSITVTFQSGINGRQSAGKPRINDGTANGRYPPAHRCLTGCILFSHQGLARSFVRIRADVRIHHRSKSQASLDVESPKTWADPVSTTTLFGTRCR